MSNFLKNGNVTLEAELITPAKAREYLTVNTNNRRIKEVALDSYKRAHLINAFFGEVIFIGFNQQGVLANGQHTLRTIVDTEKSLRVWVLRNLTPEQVAAMDRGAQRSMTDAVRIIFGGDTEEASKVNHKVVAVIKIIVNGIENRERMLVEHVIDVVSGPVADSVQFGSEFSAPAPVCAVLAKAHATGADVGRLLEFKQVYNSGVCIYGEKDSAAIRIRELIRGGGAAGHKRGQEIFWKTMSAMNNFLQKTPLSKVYAVDKDYFKIPKSKLPS